MYKTTKVLQTISNHEVDLSILKAMCYHAARLYNVALYSIRQHYFNEKKYLNYYSVNRTFSETKNVDYIALPYVQMAQQVLIQVDKCFSSFILQISFVLYYIYIIAY